VEALDGSTELTGLNRIRGTGRLAALDWERSRLRTLALTLALSPRRGNWHRGVRKDFAGKVLNLQASTTKLQRRSNVQSANIPFSGCWNLEFEALARALAFDLERKPHGEKFSQR
jgi:hypothetical protein